MKKWLRWKGLIIFGLSVGLLIGFSILFIDPIIKRSIEYTVTAMVGAETNLDKVEFRFSPMGMKIDRVQITDPDKATHNIVDIRQISFNMDSLNILRRKVLINDMRVDGVRFDTARHTAGHVKKAKDTRAEQKEKQQSDGFKMPDISIPGVDEVMQREEIKTIGQAETFKKNIQTSENNWNKIVAQMPDEKRIDSHKQRLDTIKKTNTKDVKALADALEDLKKLKKDIKADINYVETAPNKISNELNQLKTDYKNLKDSPSEEYKRLSNKYSASMGNVGNISHLLFGQEAKQYSELAMRWYKQLEPYLAYVDFSGGQQPKVDRHKGLDIRFKEYHPLPDFLIKVAHTSVETEKGNFTGKIMDITDQQDVTRKPMTMKFTGNKLQGIGSILLTGTFNHINPTQANDQINFDMNNYQLDKYRLIDQSDMTIYLHEARSDIKIVAKRINDKIQADFRSHIHSIKYNNKASGNELSMMFLSSINKTRDFNIYGKLRGTFDHYSTEVSSDLDNRLKAGMHDHVNKRMAGFRKQLQEKIHLKTRQPLQDAEKKFKEINSMVKNDTAIRKAKLTQQYNEVIEEEKRKQREKRDNLKSKVKGKLDNLLNKYK